MVELLGERIAVLRRAKSLSQSQLAEKLNISPSTIGMYEQGRRAPSLELIVELAKILSVSTDLLLTGRPAPPETDDNATYQQVIQTSLQPLGLKICVEHCCKQYSLSTLNRRRQSHPSMTSAVFILLVLFFDTCVTFQLRIHKRSILV